MFCLFTLLDLTLLPYQSPEKIGNLSEEFIEFQLLCDEDIPKQTRDKATFKVDCENDNFYKVHKNKTTFRLNLDRMARLEVCRVWARTCPLT